MFGTRKIFLFNVFPSRIFRTASFLCVLLYFSVSAGIAAPTSVGSENGLYYTAYTGPDSGRRLAVFNLNTQQRRIDELKISTYSGQGTIAPGPLAYGNGSLFIREKKSGNVLKIDPAEKKKEVMLQSSVKHMCAGKKRLFFLREDGLYSSDLCGRRQKQLYEGSNIDSMQCADETLYILLSEENTGDTIRSINTSTGAMRTLVSGSLEDFSVTDGSLYFVSGENGDLEKVNLAGSNRRLVFSGGIASAPKFGPDGWMYLKMHDGGLWKMDRSGGMRTRIAEPPIADWNIAGAYLFIQRGRTSGPVSIVDLRRDRSYSAADFMREGGLLPPEEAHFRLVPGLVYHVVKGNGNFPKAREAWLRLFRYDGVRDRVEEILDFMRTDDTSGFRYPVNTYMKGLSERELNEQELQRAEQLGAITFESLLRRGAVVREKQNIAQRAEENPVVVLEPLSPDTITEIEKPLDRAEKLMASFPEADIQHSVERMVRPEEGRIHFKIDIKSNVPEGSYEETDFRLDSLSLDFHKDPKSGEVREFTYEYIRRYPPDSRDGAYEPDPSLEEQMEKVREYLQGDVEKKILRIFHLIKPDGEHTSREFSLSDARVRYSFGEAGGMSVYSFELVESK
jgi:hypothetical protein